jgi:hypothetical protein
MEKRFASRLLPLFKRHTEEIGALLPELYLHGLSLGDFDLALRGLLGDAAPLSPSSILRLKQEWQEQYDTWKRRDLSDLDIVYLWADGIYVKAGLEKDKTALLVLIGATSNGEKVILAVESGQRESVESWSSVLRDLKARGATCAEAHHCRRPLGNLGRDWQRVSVFSRTEVLESQAEKRAGCSTEEASASDEDQVTEDRVSGDEEGMRATEARVPEVVRTRTSESGRATGP